MRYKNKNITKLSDWAIVLYLNHHGKATNKEMAKQFNNSTSIVSVALMRLLNKDIISFKKSEEPGEWRTKIYFLK